MKFGGTSVGSAVRFKNVASLVTSSDGPKVVVLSAMSGTTDALFGIAAAVSKGDLSSAMVSIDVLVVKYHATIAELFTQDNHARQKASAEVEILFDSLRSLAGTQYGDLLQRKIVAHGELLSTAIMHIYLQSIGVKSALLPALEFMRTDAASCPDMPAIASSLHAMLKMHDGVDVYVTQGFICRNSQGEVDNLKRGGSDYSATIIGAALRADSIEIWTDIDGLHDNDPRYVSGTKSLPEISFDQAAELALFGAKILHPTCVIPARDANIPIRLLNTLDPKAVGTLIGGQAPTVGVKAVAARDDGDKAYVCAVADFDEPTGAIRSGLFAALDGMDYCLISTNSKPWAVEFTVKTSDKINTLKSLQQWSNI